MSELRFMTLKISASGRSVQAVEEGLRPLPCDQVAQHRCNAEIAVKSLKERLLSELILILGLLLLLLLTLHVQVLLVDKATKSGRWDRIETLPDKLEERLFVQFLHMIL